MKGMRSLVSWLMMVVVMAVCTPMASFASVSSDEVTSVKLKEADGTSGQNTNTGSGVKTGHIQNGAVTDAKIAGPISASKLGTYANTFIVHKGQANNVTTFNSLVACLNYLTNGTANWTGDRVAITIMPGRYDGEDFSAYGTSTVNADIIGASRDGSIIAPTGMVMHLPSGMNLKNLTIDGAYVNIDHIVNSGIYDAKIIGSPQETYYATVEAGWQNISNFTMDNVEIVTWTGSIGLNGTTYNDTLTLKNIKIVAMAPGAGHITILYPSTDRPIKFSNVTFYGPGSSLFNFVLCSNTNFILDNIKVEGEYTGGFAVIYGATNMKMKISNSNLNVPVLMPTDQGGAVETTIDNSTIASLTGIVGSLKISNSKINGPIPNNGALKIVNSFDSNYDPIANGLY